MYDVINTGVIDRVLVVCNKVKFSSPVCLRIWGGVFLVAFELYAGHLWEVFFYMGNENDQKAMVWFTMGAERERNVKSDEYESHL